MPRHPIVVAVALAVTAAATVAATAAPRATPRATPRLATRTAAETSYVVAATDSAAGAYLTIVGGCNDCHTAGWGETNGRTPEVERLAGSPVGYRGPWGTSYAANLRALTTRMTEDRWVQVLRTADGGHGRPPMPWMNTAMMSERDLRNLYRYVKALGPRGERMPRAVSPDSEPRTPYIDMTPRQPGSGVKVTKDRE
jgi:cytochrome c1